ncbi:MAG: Fe(2+)-trafficking protein [Phycisphaeraceae bacterium]|nr:Fe(2+)-trafficking protein [Phycisphaeraceae bacterium]
MDLDTRIAQFEKMAADDPANDMAHFSLGSAYNQAGRYEDAAAAFLRCVSINPAMSKAYQLAGAALMAAQQTQRAGEVLTEGYKVAAGRGDLMPKNAIGEMLRKLDLPVPEVEPKRSGPAPDGSFVCRRTGRPGTKMARPPFKGPVGEWIHANIAKETFDQWIGQGTKVINELRLDMSRDEDAATYDKYMEEFLGIDAQMREQIVTEWRAKQG